VRVKILILVYNLSLQRKEKGKEQF